MAIKESFGSLRNHFPFRSKNDETFHPEVHIPGPPLTAEELLPPLPETDNPRILLADSIDQLNNPLASSVQQEEIRKIVVNDAENLAAHLLPKEVAEALELEATQEVEDTTPTLPALFLLAEASDATGDEKIARAIDYLMTTRPPSQSDELREAVLAARKNHTPIMEEFIRIKAEGDAKADAPKDPKQMEVILGARRATPAKYRNPADEGIDQTGVGIH